NRRGYAPALMCHDCGWLAECNRCNKFMTLHKQKKILWCHHCDRQIRLIPECPECGQTGLIEVGHGTERIEEALGNSFSHAKIIRIDRDTTRRKDSMKNMYEQVVAGEADILIGTQMLAKGHHFPAVTLAAIVDIDSSLYSSDFRATERMGQLITQVSGRAGRGEHPGLVLVQTHFPEHPLLHTLLHDGYMAFSRALLKDREAAGLPPFTYMAMLRAESNSATDAETFLCDVRSEMEKEARAVQIHGPVPAPMERRAGRFRMQLLLQSTRRNVLQAQLKAWISRIEGLKSSRRVRWSIDVDPLDMM
ncbi:MAG: primosomal protein N', partial [Thiotrichales bacterium]|nr:primosomal protein N' [Thiotrichales bacterium]